MQTGNDARQKFASMKTILHIGIDDDGVINVSSDLMKVYELEDAAVFYPIVRHYYDSLDRARAHAKEPFGHDEPTPRNPELINMLSKWRRAKALELNLSPGYVLTNNVILQIAERTPLTELELMQVKGFGARMYEKFGKELIDIVQGYLDYVADEGTPQVNEEETE